MSPTQGRGPQVSLASPRLADGELLIECNNSLHWILDNLFKMKSDLAIAIINNFYLKHVIHCLSLLKVYVPRLKMEEPYTTLSPVAQILVDSGYKQSGKLSQHLLKASDY